ncbi:L-ribulokinase [Jatrophihabitans endophyticus]|uniref:Ribulokinase n=1 Tax=Jatrophihabitans endophyticus TaxID=1206085 RepID=A0A1M5DNL6_9ACTN|nr:ribulokinase [Jatrophihabitans endophyticus]SHF68372.1 L-ribulokinase [Jatrophihabitans endophyticus]
MAARHGALTVGIDFGTLSGRAVVVRVADGVELGTAVHAYRHGVLTERLPTDDRRLPPDWALQVPRDYVEVLQHAVPSALAAAGVEAADVVGVATDFTACTMLPVTGDGTPLCELADFVDRPHAYVKLWKHHAAQPHADRINSLAAKRNESWLPRYGGLISSEWEFAKALQLFDEDREVYDAMRYWVEAADWIVWQLCGNYVRNACTAGYKGIRQDGAYPSRSYLAELDPDFADFVTAKLERPIGGLGDIAGRLTSEAAAWTGLPEGIAVAVGNVDAHVTAPAAQAVEAGQLVAIMGTSTCHVMSSDVVREVPGMCGVVADGIVPGLWGYEAGQSGVGDIFAWFVDTCVPPDYVARAEAEGRSVHDLLAELAAAQPVGAHGLLALDWHSGNRSPLVDHELSGLLLGQTLATRPEDTYRALVESTAYGARSIVTAFRAAGVPVTEFVATGGLAASDFVMQIYADVLRMPLSVLDSGQGPALGSAIFAAVAAGQYEDIAAAAVAMGRRRTRAWEPDDAAADRYDVLYAEYTALVDHFGRTDDGVMHRLRRLRRDAWAAADGAAS